MGFNSGFKGLKLILKEWHGMAWTGFLKFRIGRYVICCEHHDAASVLVKSETSF